jgi:hypothetical protein
MARSTVGRLGLEDLSARRFGLDEAAHVSLNGLLVPGSQRDETDVGDAALAVESAAVAEQAALGLGGAVPASGHFPYKPR